MDYNIPTEGYSREEKWVFLEFQLFSYIYKKLIKISYVGLYKIYDWPKFEGHNSLNTTAMPLRSSKLKLVWRTQFLSHTLQMLGKLVFFENLQMILLSFLEIFIIAKVSKNVPKLFVQVWRSLWFSIGKMNCTLFTPHSNLEVYLNTYYTVTITNQPLHLRNALATKKITIIVQIQKTIIRMVQRLLFVKKNN